MNDLASRSRSKVLFGNRYMLEVCVGIASRMPERVNLGTLIGETGLSPSVYVGPLRKLVAVGLLIDAPAGGADDRRERWYRPAESKLWGAALELTGWDQPGADR